MVNSSTDVSEEVQKIANEIPNLVACGLRDLKERENYFLAQEKFIRQRVQLLDEAQSLIIRERDMLKKQHDHCREQIAQSRTQSDELQDAEINFRRLANISPFLKRKENLLNNALQTVSEAIEELDESLNKAFKEKDKLQTRHEALKEAERMKSTQTIDLLNDVQKLTSEKKHLEQDIVDLKRERDNLTQWSDRLEKKEMSIATQTRALLERLTMAGILLHGKRHSLQSLQDVLAKEDIARDQEAASEDIDINADINEE